MRPLQNGRSIWCLEIMNTQNIGRRTTWHILITSCWKGKNCCVYCTETVCLSVFLNFTGFVAVSYVSGGSHGLYVGRQSLLCKLIRLTLHFRARNC